MRVRFLKNALLTAFLATFAVLNTGCGGAEAQKGFTESPSLGDDEDDGTNSPGNTTGFYVRAATPDWPLTTLMHKFYDRTSPCLVSTATTGASADIQCMLNVREADLFYSDLKWEFNAPPGMCAWIRETPYFYYNNLPGVGPTSINVTISGTPAEVTDCEIDGNPVTPTDGVCKADEVVIDGSGVPKCTYDYTGSKRGNCCEGTYSFTKRTSTDVTTTTEDWGGAYGNCARGVYQRNGWPVTGDSNLPDTQVSRGDTGINRTFNATKSIGVIQHSSNVDVANFWGWTAYAGGNHSAATVPMPIRTRVDLANNDPVPANSAYLYECVGQAGELRARIRMYVNEWNTSAAFTSYLGGSVSVRPDVGGIENVGCYSEGFAGGACDDFYSWGSDSADSANSGFRNLNGIYPNWK